MKKAAIKKKAANSKPPAPKLNYRKNFFIVGIGASAGGLEALKIFFENIAADSGIAFVIVQHMDPTHKSILAEILAGHTKMKVVEISEALKIEPNCVYVIPSNKDLTITDNTLHLVTPVDQRAKRRPIDQFFRSLATDQKDRAIGIILSGTGTEGTLGLKDIKSEGGMSIVQNPKTAQFGGMPSNAIDANVGDFILPPEKMPEKILAYITQRNLASVKISPEHALPVLNDLKKIFVIIRQQTGYDFSNYKTNTILRRVTKRIAINQINSIKEYVGFLQKNTTEIEKLYKDFLIGVTSFFRDPEVFELLEKKAIPALLDKNAENHTIRIWVCACSTGEEAYSIAMLFKEALEKTNVYFKVVIFASDIDKDAIETARKGIYPENVVTEISADRLKKYFVKKENKFHLVKEIREMVVFAHHDVIKDPPFLKIDMISCRNMLIYINSEVQKKLIQLFHYSLNQDGILVLGTSESIGEFSDLFAEYDDKIKIFIKKSVSTRKNKTIYEHPFVNRKFNLVESGSTNPIMKKTNIFGSTDKFLLDQYAPPSVIIDVNNDALYFSGNTGLYLEPPVGMARFNIIEMAKKGLKISLEDAIQKARKENTEIYTKAIDVLVNDQYKTAYLRIKPLLSKEYEKGTLIVIFEPETKTKKSGDKKSGQRDGKSKQKNTELEKELRITQEHLQSAVKDLETSNEDLQSTNEELQSTNEELETSREELQSVNEELITVNSELTIKIDQLSQANNDLNNLLRSIEVATIYLDRELKVKRFTPAATKIFNLIPSDIDRPVTQLSSNLLYKNLAEDIKYSLKTLEVKSLEVCNADGLWYYMHIIPYRVDENIIEGVLVTLVDITYQKGVELNLKKTNEHLNLILENLPAIPYIVVKEAEFKFEFIGITCEKITGFSSSQFTGKMSFWINRLHPDDKKKMLATFANIAKKGSFNQPFRWKCADGKYKHFMNNIRYAAADGGRPPYIVGVWQKTLTEKISKEKN